MPEATHDGWTVDSQAETPDAAVSSMTGADAGTTSPVESTGTPLPPSPAAESSSSPDDSTGDPDTQEQETAPDGETAEQKAARDEQGRFKRKNPQARFDKLTYEARQAERERDEARSRAEQLEARLAALERGESPRQPQQQAQPAEGKPTLDQFNDYEAFIEAVAEWKADQKFAQIEQARQQREADARALSARQAYTERATAFAATTPDWQEVVTSSTAPMSAAMHEAVLASERGPELAYFLATHPQEAERLTQQSRDWQASAAPLMRELLESKLRPSAAESGAAGQTPPRSAGPRPITPVGAGPVTAETSPDALPFGPNYVDAMNRKDAEQRRRRMGG